MKNTISEKIDTRNRFQRMFDARYNDKIVKSKQPISKAEFHALSIQNQTNLDKFEYLSRLEGSMRKHPRTKELIQFQTSDVQNYSKFPRVAYHRRQNQKIQQITATIQDGKLNVEIESVKPRKTNQWQSVWYSKHQRRK